MLSIACARLRSIGPEPEAIGALAPAWGAFQALVVDKLAADA